MKRLTIIAFAVTALVVPAAALAQQYYVPYSSSPYSSSQPYYNGPNSQGSLSVVNNANDLIDKIASIGDVVLYLLVGLAVVFIVWNIVIYMIRGSDPAEKAKAAHGIAWGLAGLFVIVSLWGLVNILVNTFATNQYNTPPLPNANFVNGSQY